MDSRWRVINGFSLGAHQFEYIAQEKKSCLLVIYWTIYAKICRFDKILYLNLFIFQDGFAVPEDDGDDLPPQPVEEY